MLVLISWDWLGFEMISLAYLLVSGDRKLFPSKNKSVTHRDDSMKESEVEEEKRKKNIDHVKLQYKQTN